MFPDDFWYELARLEGVRYSPRNRPLRWENMLWRSSMMPSTVT
jgi:hypothetical protein